MLVIYARMAIIGSEMNLCWNTETFLTLAAPVRFFSCFSFFFYLASQPSSSTKTSWPIRFPQISLSVCVTSFQDMWPNVTDPLTNCYTFSNSSLPSSSAVEVSTNANSTAVVLQQGAWAGIQTFSSVTWPWYSTLKDSLEFCFFLRRMFVLDRRRASLVPFLLMQLTLRICVAVSSQLIKLYEEGCMRVCDF